MDTQLLAATLLSALAFAFFGPACLLSQRMVEEFERYGLARWRRLTGWLETAGAAGLLAGLALPVLLPAAALGLTALMTLGVLTRLRIRDTFWQTLPAATLLALNAYIAARTLSVAPGA